MGRQRPSSLSGTERHATYIPQVLGTLRSVGETAIGRRLGSEAVDAARPPGDLRATHLLYGADTAERPEVTVGDPRELLLDALHELACDLQAGVRAVLRLRVKTHSGIVAGQV